MSIKCRILLQRRKQAEIHVHRLERGRPRIDRVDMATGYMRKQRAMRRGSGWGRDPFAAPLGGGKTPSSRPTAADSTYPSQPVIWPAKRQRVFALSRKI